MLDPGVRPGIPDLKIGEIRRVICERCRVGRRRKHDTIRVRKLRTELTEHFAPRLFLWSGKLVTQIQSHR